MGQGLYTQFPIFRDTIDNLVAQYKTLSGVDLIQDHSHPLSICPRFEEARLFYIFTQNRNIMSKCV